MYILDCSNYNLATIFQSIRDHPTLREKQIHYESQVQNGQLNPGVAADLLLEEFWRVGARPSWSTYLLRT